MQLHQIQPIHKRKRKKRVGRGGKRGTYSGRGIKGQNARAGSTLKPIIRDIIKRYPKLRGYRVQYMGKGLEVVNVGKFDRLFSAGTTITPELLAQKNLISRIKGKAPSVKILGEGEIKKAFTFEDCTASKSAKEKIEKAGGSIQ